MSHQLQIEHFTGEISRTCIASAYGTVSKKLWVITKVIKGGKVFSEFSVMVGNVPVILNDRHDLECAIAEYNQH
jgi:hypothetical protein